MNIELARQVADTILLEGYAHDPYRASPGVLVPAGHHEAADNRTECLVELGEHTELDLVLRFLQLQCGSGEPAWDEGVLREVPATVTLEPSGVDVTIPFTIDGGTEHGGAEHGGTEHGGTEHGGTEHDWATVRQRWPLDGSVRVTGALLDGPSRLMRVSIRVRNSSQCPPAPLDRPQLLRHSLITAHTLLAVRGGTFLSLLEPPEWAGSAAALCANERTFPVLIGEGRGDVMLSSPVILYDYPTETRPTETRPTETRPTETRPTETRPAETVEGGDTMSPDMVERLHGVIRYLRATDAAPAQVPWWDPDADRSVAPQTDRVAVPGGDAGRGSRVRLRPREHGTDAQDMFLRGRTGVVEAVLPDVDGTTHLAVTLEDDPAADLARWYGRYLYFVPDEVELVDNGE